MQCDRWLYSSTIALFSVLFLFSAFPRLVLAQNIPPTVEIVNGPPDGGTITFNDPTFVYSGSDLDGSVVCYNIALQGPEVRGESCVTETSSQFIDPPLSNGTYTFSVQAVDDEDATSDFAQRTFTVAVPDGQFGPEQVITETAASTKGIASADFDGDGDADVVAARFSGTLAWYANDGNGTFSAQPPLTTDDGGVDAVFTVDLDSDGDVDVLSVSSVDKNLSWYENAGDGSFGPQIVIAQPSTSPSDVLAEDLDTDGDLDVVVSEYNNGDIKWYENDGAETFGDGQLVAGNAFGSRSIDVADFDGDGDPDLISGNAASNRIGWYANDGTGSFGFEQIITFDIGKVRSVVAADLDGDGDDDVLAASGDGDYWTPNEEGIVAWFENDGTGNFSSENILTNTAGGVYTVRAPDIDNDGDRDALYGSYPNNNILWQENNGNGTFGAAREVSITAEGVWSVETADINSDGQLDVIAGLFSGERVSWYENQVEVTNTAPTVEITSGPSDGSTVGPTFQFEWQGDDPDGDALTYEIELDGQDFVEGPKPPPGGPEATVAEFSGIPAGNYTFRVWAIDEEGALSQPTTRAFTVEDVSDSWPVVDGAGLILKIGADPDVPEVHRVRLHGRNSLYTEDAEVEVSDGFAAIEIPILIVNNNWVDLILKEVTFFDGSDNLLGHIRMDESVVPADYEAGRQIHAYVHLHSDTDALDLLPKKDRYPSPKNNDWDYYEEGEFPVSMLIPPGETVESLQNPTAREPLLLVHGVDGIYPNWNGSAGLDGSDDFLNDLGVDFHVWQFYYPYDQEIDKSGQLLGKAIPRVLDPTDLVGSNNPYENLNLERLPIVAHSMGGVSSTRVHPGDHI